MDEAGNDDSAATAFVTVGLPQAADQAAWVPLVEVLGVIVFGRANGFTHDTVSQMIEQWGGPLDFTIFPDPKWNILVRAIRILLIRERRWRERRQSFRLPGPNPRLRATVRAAWHRHGRRPFRELLFKLRADLSAYPQLVADREAALKQAGVKFIAAAIEHDVVLYGCEGNFRSRRLTSGLHEAIDLRLFANSHRVITDCNWTTIERDHPEEGGDYGDLKIRRVDLAKLLPRQPAAITAVDNGSPARSGGRDYRRKDDVLAAEIIKGVKEGKLRSDWHGCWTLVGRAEGTGDDTNADRSKQKRLSKRVKRLRKSFGQN